MFANKLLTAVSVLMISSNIALADSPQPPRCIFIDDAPVDVATCLSIACLKMRTAWGNCTDQACRDQVYAQYFSDYLACIPVAQFFNILNNRNEGWITIGFDGSKMTYQYPGDI